ncbi:cupin domain-containing protein [Zobellia uliginosa]|uniref:cupin domain-containing protein n=1 Tax=Zobellia uliginosa TaxID=143224 RepID=UPI001C06E9AB|nr:cupin domain-containing protein [Zobellia uliginosa]MBU2945736.1 cupin domain-containing protein [Zobellia uliginosa]
MIEKRRWDSIPEEEINEKMQRQLVFGEKIMVGRMKFKDGFLVPLHKHENEQFTDVHKGTIRFWFGEDKSKVIDVHAGEFIIIPGNLPHEALMIGDVEETDTFTPLRQDWIDKTDAYLRQ